MTLPVEINPLLLGANRGYQIQRSVRLRSSASAYFNRTPASASTVRTQQTFSFWLKRGSLGSQQILFTGYDGTSTQSTAIYFLAGDTLEIDFGGAAKNELVTSQVFRDPSAWYHIVVAFDTTQATAANRVSIYINGTKVSTFGTANYPAQNATSQFGINNANQKLCTAYNAGGNFFDGYLTEVNFIDGQALTPSSFGQNDPTTGVWQPKKYTGSYGTNGFYLNFSDNSAVTNLGYDYSRGFASGTNILLYSEQLDNAAWTKDGTTISANQTTAPDGATTADKAVETAVNNQHLVYQSQTVTTGATYTASFYLKAAERTVALVQLADASASPKRYTVLVNLTNGSVITTRTSNTPSGTANSVTSVGNGWYRVSVTMTQSGGTTMYAQVGLADSTSPTWNSVDFPTYLGDITKGIYVWGGELEIGTSPTTYTQTTAAPAPNNWTPNNISLTAGATYDSMLDVPTPWGDGGNGRGNYPTLNVIDNGIARTTVSNANLSALFTGAAAGAGIRASGFQMPTTGKWYAEFTLVAKPTLANASSVGISRVDTVLNSTANWYIGTGANDFAWSWGTGFSNKANNNTGSAYGTAPAVGDVIGVAIDLDTNPGAFTLTFYNNGTSQGAAWTNQSTGGQTFAFGCSGTDNTNFAANFGQRPFAYTPPTGFKALNTQNLPDPTIKAGNKFFDATTYTGNGSTQSIVNAGAFQPDFVWVKDRTAANSNMLFDSVRGIYNTLVSNSTQAEVSLNTSLTAFNSNGFSVGNYANVNTNADALVGWQWKRGATQGFDIVLYTGDGNAAGTRAIAHGLGVAPKLIISKARSTTSDWVAWTTLLGGMKYLTLNTTAAAAAAGETAPTSSNFYVGGNNTNGVTYVTYLFAEVAGFSKFGSYTGNGSTDGPFVYCGFRPRFVMIKRTDAAGEAWQMFDTSRNSYNVMNALLQANNSVAETTTFSPIDTLSNGFKIRDTNTAWNASGGAYIFAAFAENPFKYSLAR